MCTFASIWDMVMMGGSHVDKFPSRDVIRINEMIFIQHFKMFI